VAEQDNRVLVVRRCREQLAAPDAAGVQIADDFNEIPPAARALDIGRIFQIRKSE
jgi:hypothetical protein